MDEWRFALSNNALDRFRARQAVHILRNETPLRTVILNNTEKTEVKMDRVRSGETFSFISDFEFRPSDLGEDDRRNLSFMFW